MRGEPFQGILVVGADKGTARTASVYAAREDKHGR